MAKKDEANYFEAIGEAGKKFTVNKPYSDRVNIGSLMHNISAIMTMLYNHYGESSLTILDMGCGSGWTSHQFARAGHDVTGVDISPTAIKLAKQSFKLPNLRYAECDYDRSGGAFKKKFDVVIFHDSLHHSDDPAQTLRVAKRVLKQNGICILCEPGRGHSTSPDAVEAVEKYGVTEKDMPPSFALRVAKEAGFTSSKTYVSPALMHRLLFREYSVGKKAMIKYPFARLMVMTYAYLFKSSKEGIVVLYP